MIRLAVAALAAGLAAAAVAANAGGPALSMDQQQSYLVEHAYPGAKVMFDCEGNFSGASDHEHVLGLEAPGRSAFRIGLTLDHGRWTFHDIEHELTLDKLPRHYRPMGWETGSASLPPKCNVDVRRERDLSVNGKPLDKPLFALRPRQANACFTTSEQYNNWDCVAYRNGHFVLWYQQEFAD